MNKIISVLFLCFFVLSATAEQPTKPQQICSPQECYTILEDLGEGAFGKVVKAQDSQGRIVAIKSYKSPVTSVSDLSYINPFQDAPREFQLGQIFDHPHIIKSINIFNSSPEPDTQYSHIVLQYVEGKTINKTIKGALEFENSKHAALELLDAIFYAYSKGYLHMDLHDGNVMLENASSAMVIDLASFFTVEEIEGHMIALTGEKNDQDGEIVAQNINGIGPHRAAKLSHFFAAHPEIQKEIHAKNELLAHGRVMEETSVLSTWQAFVFSGYLKSVTDLCTNIILKSVRTKEVRMNIRSELAKIAWSYMDDIEDGLNPDIHIYLNLLLDKINQASDD